MVQKKPPLIRGGHPKQKQYKKKGKNKMKKLGLVSMFACGNIGSRTMNKWTWKMLSSMVRDETTLYEDIIEYGFCTETELENIVTMYNR